MTPHGCIARRIKVNLFLRKCSATRKRKLKKLHKRRMKWERGCSRDASDLGINLQMLCTTHAALSSSSAPSFHTPLNSQDSLVQCGISMNSYLRCPPNYR
uniref:Uncharacterized protein n=1 Tax=Parascaris univalens TaxID=6257 RepID=A0A915BSE5_PARUN